MIPVARGPEPAALRQERRVRLSRAILAKQQGQSVEFAGYDTMKQQLVKALNHKCCYCEMMLRIEGSPVEHFRPKAGVKNPGDSALDRSRYWWLAWTWENLLFACDRCNTNHKGNQFPLRAGTKPLLELSVDLDSEQALLIDPARIDPRDHIRFVFSETRSRFIPRPVNGSPLGRETLKTLALDEPDDVRDDHVRRLTQHELPPLRDILASNDSPVIQAYWLRLCRKLFEPAMPFHAVTWDVLDWAVPATQRATWGLSLPQLGRAEPPAKTPLFDPQDDPPELADLAAPLQMQVRALGDRASPAEVQAVMRALLGQKDWTDEELARLLQRAPDTVQSYRKQLASPPGPLPTS
jgi:uncharacterized protein (TIGR02646 family)